MRKIVEFVIRALAANTNARMMGTRESRAIYGGAMQGSLQMKVATTFAANVVIPAVMYARLTLTLKVQMASIFAHVVITRIRLRR